VRGARRRGSQRARLTRWTLQQARRDARAERRIGRPDAGRGERGCYVAVRCRGVAPAQVRAASLRLKFVPVRAGWCVCSGQPSHTRRAAPCRLDSCTTRPNKRFPSRSCTTSSMRRAERTAAALCPATLVRPPGWSAARADSAPDRRVALGGRGHLLRAATETLEPEGCLRVR
jgi:hypothetical protein